MFSPKIFNCIELQFITKMYLHFSFLTLKIKICTHHRNFHEEHFLSPCFTVMYTLYLHVFFTYIYFSFENELFCFISSARFMIMSIKLIFDFKIVPSPQNLFLNLQFFLVRMYFVLQLH